MGITKKEFEKLTKEELEDYNKKNDLLIEEFTLVVNYLAEQVKQRQEEYLKRCKQMLKENNPFRYDA